jgi:KUP system potassium uptake protein
VTVNDLGNVADGLVHISVHVGFTDSQDVPKGLALAVGKSPELEDIDLDTVHYFLSVLTVHATGPRGLRSWRKRLYVWMHHNAANRTEVFHLPPDRTIVMGAHLEL